MSSTRQNSKFQFAIDRGGTFTDIYARCPGGKVRVMKLLSVDPANYPDAPREGIRRILEEETGVAMPSSAPVDASNVEWIRMGTTVATNALLERKGERVALAITEGFRDLLHIGNQARPSIFDLSVRCPELLYEAVVETHGRVILARDDCQLSGHDTWRRVQGSTGETLLVTHELDEAKLRADLTRVLERGIASLAVVLAHSYTFAEHELRVGHVARELGFRHVSLSHQVMPMVRMVPRGFTACADAYLTPHIQTYVQSFASGFKNNLQGVNVLFMQSDGGLTPMDNFNGSRAILSGPAGGVVGYALTAWSREEGAPVIGFDMGGTSTDVSRYDGEFEHVFESTTAGVTIQAPQLDVNTVAAGGGSRLFFRSGMLVAGPESAGAHPGPACYRKSGPLTVTDANLVLGRLLPEFFPKIFGPNEDQPLDKEAALRAFTALTAEINAFSAAQEESKEKPPMSVEEVALGFVRVANEAMCRPIRALTQAKGYDTSKHVLACFGGAGGQHACAVARSLGMRTVLIHKYAGILSAYGMALASVVHEAQEPCAKTYTPENFSYLDERLSVLEVECRERLLSQGLTKEQIRTEPFLHLRYEGTDCALMCGPDPTISVNGPKHGDFLATFLQRYQREFGFTIPGRPVYVDDVRVRGVGEVLPPGEPDIQCVEGPPPVEKKTMIHFEEGVLEAPVLLLKRLGRGHVVRGPAIIMDGLSTLLVEPDCSATVTARGDVRIDVQQARNASALGEELDAVQLSIFSHRFMSIAEQMGRILQRTAISTNIKERLDFSCALFGPDGGLVSNAPHIPVHLGAMQEAVQFQLRHLGNNLAQGDVILSNHPRAGGSHLPDLTVITPVFHSGEERPVFFVASRGHHADIGGLTPGSMPPHSTSLSQEGAAFVSFKLVEAGRFRQTELEHELRTAGTRNLHDNLADLQAQVAANQKGIQLVGELIASYGLRVVQSYMAHVQHNAELAVRDLLRRVAAGLPSEARGELRAHDHMDDGSRICLAVKLDPQAGSAVFDFTGTGYEVWGNCNAPRAITLSAIIYCLRCMVAHDVPLNQGCLAPVRVVIPPGSLLDPSEGAAVVGGNVLTSQRIVDVVFRAFAACAASQGCMNNITFGASSWGYYETVAGGAGAGPGWHGRGGVHSHMTNTRITDPEVVERRYPVLVEHFSLRPHSGGAGQWRGGDGVRRDLRFRRPLTLSVLTERRVFAPYGLKGGHDGERGSNLLLRTDGRVINLGSKTAVDVLPGDTFRLLTPGGGGYGASDEGSAALSVTEKGAQNPIILERGSVFEYRRAQESV